MHRHVGGERSDVAESPELTEDQAQALEALKDSPMSVGMVAVERLHPNPWNPNRMDDRTRAAARESIARFGFIDPVTVRPHPGREGHFQIIDGEHRVEIARDEHGYSELPVVSVELSDVDAEMVTIVFNDTRGEHDDVLLGQSLVRIREAGGDEAMTVFRYGDSQMAHLLELGQQDLTAYAPPDPADHAPPDEPDPGPEIPEKWQGWGIDELAALIEPDVGDQGKLFRQLQGEAKEVTARMLSDEPEPDAG